MKYEVEYCTMYHIYSTHVVEAFSEEEAFKIAKEKEGNCDLKMHLFNLDQKFEECAAIYEQEIVSETAELKD